MRKPENVQVREATGTKAQRRQLSDDRIWRRETVWMIGPVPVSIFTVEKDTLGEKEDSRAKLVKAIGIIIKIARG